MRRVDRHGPLALRGRPVRSKSAGTTRRCEGQGAPRADKPKAHLGFRPTLACPAAAPPVNVARCVRPRGLLPSPCACVRGRRSPAVPFSHRRCCQRGGSDRRPAHSDPLPQGAGAPAGSYTGEGPSRVRRGAAGCRTARWIGRRTCGGSLDRLTPGHAAHPGGSSPRPGVSPRWPVTGPRPPPPGPL